MRLHLGAVAGRIAHVRFVKEDPWWNSRVDTTTSEDIGCFLIGCLPEIGLPLLVIFLPIYGMVRFARWITARLRPSSRGLREPLFRMTGASPRPSPQPHLTTGWTQATSVSPSEYGLDLGFEDTTRART